MKKPAFYFNADHCMGCKACVIACKDKHNHGTDIRWRRIIEYTGGDWIPRGKAYEQNVYSYYISMACNHCDDPVCVHGCPTGAMNVGEDGIVSVNVNRCVGCRYCEWHCPYGAPQYDPEAKHMTKCDYCRDYTSQGKTPACVAACPARALDFGEYEDLKAKYGDEEHIAPLPARSITTPHFVCTPNRRSRPINSKGGAISNPEEI